MDTADYTRVEVNPEFQKLFKGALDEIIAVMPDSAAFYITRIYERRGYEGTSKPNNLHNNVSSTDDIEVSLTVRMPHWVKNASEILDYAIKAQDNQDRAALEAERDRLDAERERQEAQYAEKRRALDNKLESLNKS